MVAGELLEYGLLWNDDKLLNDLIDVPTISLPDGFNNGVKNGRDTFATKLITIFRVSLTINKLCAEWINEWERDSVVKMTFEIKFASKQLIM